MKTLLALVFFPIILVLIGSLGFAYVMGTIIASIIVAFIGFKK